MNHKINYGKKRRGHKRARPFVPPFECPRCRPWTRPPGWRSVRSEHVLRAMLVSGLCHARATLEGQPHLHTSSDTRWRRHRLSLLIGFGRRPSKSMRLVIGQFCGRTRRRNTCTLQEDCTRQPPFSSSGIHHASLEVSSHESSD